MVRAVFEQLGYTLKSYSHPVVKLSGFGNGIFDYVFIKDEGHWRVSVHVRWMDCWLYCDQRRADCKPFDFFHTFPRGGRILLERLLPTGWLEIAWKANLKSGPGEDVVWPALRLPKWTASKVCSLFHQRNRCRTAIILMQAMQGRVSHSLVL